MNSPGDFWSRRKAAVQAEADGKRISAEARTVEARQAELEQKSDAEILAELDLPDPNDLKPGDDVAGFMARAVPDRIRRRALRQLWRLNPVLANVDGLVDYGEDFTDPARVLDNIQTAYQVGRGMMAHVEAIATTSEHEHKPDEDEAPHGEITGGDLPIVEPAPAPETGVEIAVAEEDATTAAPIPRRMRFEFEG